MSTLEYLELQRYEIQDRLDEALRETEGECTEEIDALYDDLLATEFDITRKLDGYGRALECMEAEQKATATRAKLLARRSQVEANAIARMKERLLEFMRANKTKEVKGDFYKFRRCGNGGKRPITYQATADPRNAPEKFVVKKPQWDTEAVRKALERGEQLEFAHLEERGEHVRIL